MGVGALLILCRANPSTVRSRHLRHHNDASDADWAIHLEARKRWQKPSPPSGLIPCWIDMEGTIREAVSKVLDYLRKQQVLSRGQRNDVGEKD